ncbi:MAG: ribonuclease P protein component [Akkermansia sp.]|nr:ribonuclease P protein component [Akkermansia sp.]
MKRASEFAMVRAEGTSTAGRFLVLNTAPSLDGAGAYSRFGIITTKRIGHAVVRNKLRRRMREILRAHAEPLSGGLFVVLVVRASAARATYQELEADFLHLMRRQIRKITSC